MANTRDSNSTGLAIAEETSIGVVDPGTTWYTMEPNSYANFGGDVTTVARNPIKADRQNLKGTATGVDATAGFNTDFPSLTITRALQGFFFANATEQYTNQPINGVRHTAGAVSSTNKTFNAYGISTAGVVVNHLIKTSGYGVAANNALHLVTAVNSGDTVTVGDTPATETAPPATAKIEVVGYRFPSGAVAASYVSGVFTLTSSSGAAWNTFNLSVGQWVYIGSDSGSYRFATCPSGFARISSIGATKLAFDKTSFTPVADAGAGVSLDVYFGNFIQNENDPTQIIRHTYQLERTLGLDQTGTQAEYVVGAVPNEFTLNIPARDKLNCDLTYVAINTETRSGATDVKPGYRYANNSPGAYNTSSSVVRIRLTLLDPTTTLPTPLFGYVSQGSLGVKNGASIVNAVGSFGGFEVTTGNFEGTGSITAYFTTVAALSAVRSFSDATIDAIFASNNTGHVFDYPLIGLGGGRLNVEKDKPITIPLDIMPAKGANGYTMSYSQFAYLPTYAYSLPS